MNLRPVGGLPLVYVESPRALLAMRWSKRLFDVVGAAVALLLAAPVMAVIALAIKLEDHGPVVFKQVRVGLKGETFHFYKFRSMTVDAEQRSSSSRASTVGPVQDQGRPRSPASGDASGGCRSTSCRSC